MKTRRIQYRIEAQLIDVPTDWRKAKGIIAKRTETNMGLSQRDYSVKCDIGGQPLMVVEGFWIWWCYTHNHPLSWCELDRAKGEIAQYKTKEELLKGILKGIEVKL